MRNLKIFIGLCSVILITGCGTIKKFDTSNEYQQAVRYEKPLVLPRELQGNIIATDYEIPEVGETNHSHDVSIVPPGSKIKK